MTDASFNDFGELYRAAFGENDAERKLSLLHSVQNTITAWQDTVDGPSRTADQGLSAREANFGFFIDRK